MVARLTIATALLTLTGCATLDKLNSNPIVVGTLAVASQSECEAYAQQQPEAAQTTARYLATLHAATEACLDGINGGLVDVR